MTESLFDNVEFELFHDKVRMVLDGVIYELYADEVNNTAILRGIVPANNDDKPYSEFYFAADPQEKLVYLEDNDIIR